ncbi:MAG: hypothetical protein M3209_00385 [Acidobacteriota bacterium]|nr:hypothetical protein [Acidobacteriota bacterium]
MKVAIEKLIKENGLAALLWAVHDVVNEKRGEQYDSLEVKLAECAEFAQEIENK